MRTVVEEPDQPLVLFICDQDHTRLAVRALELCDQRWPHWSRSYSGDVALVAGWHLRVGSDVEILAGSSESSWSTADRHFRSTLMSPEERREVLTRSEGDTRQSAMSLWCSKEALAKALGTPQQMDPARLTGPTVWPDSRRGNWRATFLDTHDLEIDAVAWVVFEVPLS